MKRFFKPLEKDGSTPAKKPCLSPGKRDGDGQGKNQKDPTKFVTWNANSFLLRVKNDWPEISKFVSDFDPDVIAIQAYRIPRLVPERKVIGGNDVDSSVLAEAELVRKSIEACDSSRDAPCVVFVSKIFAMPMKMIPQGGDHRERMNGLNDEDSKSESDECFLAFARIFSGVLRAGQRVFVISALYDPLKGESSQKYIQEAELHSIYLMMGQGLRPVNEVKAGNVVAIRGLGPYISKSATLSSTRNCWPLASMEFQVSPTLRVAIEPSDPADMSALMKGLRLLNRADPFVEITVSARGH